MANSLNFQVMYWITYSVLEIYICHNSSWMTKKKKYINKNKNSKKTSKLTLAYQSIPRNDNLIILSATGWISLQNCVAYNVVKPCTCINFTPHDCSQMKELTHWPLVVLLNLWSRNTCYGLSSWVLVKLLSGESHKTPLMVSQYWFR